MLMRISVAKVDWNCFLCIIISHTILYFDIRCTQFFILVQLCYAWFNFCFAASIAVLLAWSLRNMKLQRLLWRWVHHCLQTTQGLLLWSKNVISSLQVNSILSSSKILFIWWNLFVFWIYFSCFRMFYMTNDCILTVGRGKCGFMPILALKLKWAWRTYCVEQKNLIPHLL